MEQRDKGAAGDGSDMQPPGFKGCEAQHATCERYPPARWKLYANFTNRAETVRAARIMGTRDFGRELVLEGEPLVYRPPVSWRDRYGTPDNGYIVQDPDGMLRWASFEGFWMTYILAPSEPEGCFTKGTAPPCPLPKTHITNAALIQRIVPMDDCSALIETEHVGYAASAAWMRMFYDRHHRLHHLGYFVEFSDGATGWSGDMQTFHVVPKENEALPDAYVNRLARQR